MPTLATMKTEVVNEIGLATSGTEDTLLQGWLNDAVVDLLLRTQCYVAKATLSETTGEGDYTLPSAILLIKTVRWSSAGGASRLAERTSGEDIEELRAASAASGTSYPAVYYALAGANILKVYPTPAATDTVTTFYVPRPTAMSSSGHDPSDVTYGGVPTEYHRAVVKYAEWQAGSYRDDQSSAQGERYRQQYEDEVKRIRRYVYGKGGRPAKARVGVAFRAPHDSSADY